MAHEASAKLRRLHIPPLEIVLAALPGLQSSKVEEDHGVTEPARRVLARGSAKQDEPEKKISLYS